MIRKIQLRQSHCRRRSERMQRSSRRRFAQKRLKGLLRYEQLSVFSENIMFPLIIDFHHFSIVQGKFQLFFDISVTDESKFGYFFLKKSSTASSQFSVNSSHPLNIPPPSSPKGRLSKTNIAAQRLNHKCNFRQLGINGTHSLTSAQIHPLNGLGITTYTFVKPN